MHHEPVDWCIISLGRDKLVLVDPPRPRVYTGLYITCCSSFQPTPAAPSPRTFLPTLLSSSTPPCPLMPSPPGDNVVVLGAGYTGLTTAAELTNRGFRFGLVLVWFGF